MRSVGDQLRQETRAAVARLEPLARMRLALELGDRDVQDFARARGIPITDARRRLAEARSGGRLPSVANAR